MFYISPPLFSRLLIFIKHMVFVILVSFFGIVIALFVGSIILVWISKLFKIERPNYKKSLAVLIVSGIASVIAGIVFGIINLGFLSNVLVSVATFFAFHYFYKKYYQASWKKSLGIYIVFEIIIFVISLVIVIPARLYVVSPIVVSGEAMSPTYNDGDYLLINKFSKDFSRGDVVMFRRETLSIKRIIGLPSEKVDLQGGKVFINNHQLDENYYNGRTERVDSAGTSVVLGQDEYFVLGDNRGNSFDSRSFGPITKSSIVGKVFYRVSKLTK